MALQQQSIPQICTIFKGCSLERSLRLVINQQLINSSLKYLTFLIKIRRRFGALEGVTANNDPAAFKIKHPEFSQLGGIDAVYIY